MIQESFNVPSESHSFFDVFFFSTQIEDLITKEEKLRSQIVRQISESSKNNSGIEWYKLTLTSTLVNFCPKEFGGASVFQHILEHTPEKLRMKEFARHLMSLGVIVNPINPTRGNITNLHPELLNFVGEENVLDVYGCTINLDNQSLFTVPNWVTKLSHIAELSLENNYIEYLPYSLIVSDNVKKINLKRNPLSAIPNSIEEKIIAESSLRPYAQHLKKSDDKLEWKNVDFVLLGETKAGKSSLLKSICSETSINFEKSLNDTTNSKKTTPSRFRTVDFEHKDQDCLFKTHFFST